MLFLFSYLMMFHYLCNCKLYAKQTMTKFLIIITVFFSAIMSVKGQEQESYFPYPNVPENLTTLYERSDYLIEHFWDRCNLKSAFSFKEKFKQAFSDYIGIMPYANRDVINSSIERLIKEVRKEPDNMLTLGKIAEEALYGDSAILWSDEIYYQFAKAVADTKKISSADKARFVYHANVLSHSQVGMTAFELPFTDENGKKCNLKDYIAPIVILFFNEYDCDDCVFAKARLSTNFKTNQLIDDGVITIISLSPCEADRDWKDAIKSYPDKWIKGASPEIESYFDLRMTPTIYILNQNREIIDKNVDLNALLNKIEKL